MTTDMATRSTAEDENSAAPSGASTPAITGQVMAADIPPEVRALELPRGACYDGPVNLLEVQQWAAMLAESDMLPEYFRGRPANIALASLRAKALNIPFWVGLNEIFVTEDGGVGMTALLTNYLMVRGGCKIVILRSDATACDLSMTRSDRPGETLRVSWTMTEAAQACLVHEGDIWSRYPNDSLFARAVARMGRRYAPDLTLGMAYTQGELAEASAQRARMAQRAKGAPGVLVVPDAIKAILAKLEQLKDSADPAAAVRECRQISRFAAKKGWHDEVCTPDGRTLQQVIFDVGDTLAVRAHDEARSTEPATYAADGGVLDCGCKVADFLMAGAHAPNCNGEPR